MDNNFLTFARFFTDNTFHEGHSLCQIEDPCPEHHSFRAASDSLYGNTCAYGQSILVCELQSEHLISLVDGDIINRGRSQ